METPGDHSPFPMNDNHETGGVYRLWLAVMTDAVETLQDGRFWTKGAEEFLFDPENQFFNYVCHVLEQDPDAIRERIKAGLQMSIAG